MVQNELVIPVADINRIEVVCQRDGCTGSITVNFAKNEHPHAACPACNQHLGGAVWDIGDAWKEFYRHAIAAGVQLRIKAPG
jgi:hypothetical protein